MIFKNYVILIITLLLILPYKIMANEIYLPSAGFDCSDDKYKFEFLFDRSSGQFLLDNAILNAKSLFFAFTVSK